MLYNPDWRSGTIEYITTAKTGQLVLKASITQPKQDQFMGWQFFFGDKIKGRKEELSSFNKVVLKARASQNTTANLSLITTTADAYSTPVSLTTEWKEIEIPLRRLKKSSYLLLPRPYPGFQPLHFTSPGNRLFNVTDIEKLEVTFGAGTSSPLSIEVESIRLEK